MQSFKNLHSEVLEPGAVSGGGSRAWSSLGGRVLEPGAVSGEGWSLEQSQGTLGWDGVFISPWPRIPNETGSAGLTVTGCRLCKAVLTTESMTSRAGQTRRVPGLCSGQTRERGHGPGEPLPAPQAAGACASPLHEGGSWWSRAPGLPASLLACCPACRVHEHPPPGVRSLNEVLWCVWCHPV